MKTLDQYSGMPQIQSAFMGWTTSITLSIITQAVTNGFIVDSSTEVTFDGVIQPLSPQKIMLKPEGQRAWEWLQIHCFSGRLNLNINDRIIYNGTKYKIMASNDYSLDNYIEYHAIKDFDE